jgi:hypothetical protein
MSGKGSKPRPFSVDKKTYESNWDMIFKKKDIPWDHYSDLPSPEHYEEEKKEDNKQTK